MQKCQEYVEHLQSWQVSGENQLHAATYVGPVMHYPTFHVIVLRRGSAPAVKPSDYCTQLLQRLRRVTYLHCVLWCALHLYERLSLRQR
jgi:hypothetical protein